MKRALFTMAVVAACVLVTTNVSAQSSRGGIQGTVVDDNGGPLPGVTVIVESDALIGTRTAVTDGAGTFRVPLLPPGVYKATFNLDGFQRVEQENIRVPLEGTVTLDVVLRGTFTEEVVVTGETPVIDLASTTVGSSFSQDVLNAVPVGRDFKSVTFLAAGAVDGGGIYDENLAGNPSIMGASALENRYVVDQLDTTDVAEGRAGTQISTSFIEEVQVKTAGYEAEYGGALGGVVNMVTKSGGNEFHGDVFGYFTNDSLWANAKIPETRGDVKTVDTEYDYGITLGGPIVRDNLWFFVGLNPNTLDQNVRKDVYGGDAVVQTNDFVRTYDRQYFTGKLTWRLGESNLITFNVLGDPTDIDHNIYSTNYADSPFIETNQFYSTWEEGGINYGLGWNSIFSDNVVLEASYGHHENTQKNLPAIDVTNYNDRTTGGFYTNGADSATYFGGPGFQQPKDDRTRDQFKASLTWFAGAHHELKFGAGYNSVEYDADYNMVGSSDAFCAEMIEGGALFYDFESGDYVPLAANCDSNGDGVMDGYQFPARVGNRYRVYDDFYYNRNYKNRSVGDTEELNIYAQDSWRVTDNLTLTFGIRAESSESKGEQTKTDPNRKMKFDFGDMIAPRVGFVWDPSSEGRAKVFAHYGKFYQSIPLTINFRSFGNEFYDFYFYYNPDSGLPSTTNPGLFTYWYQSSSENTFLDPTIDPQYLEEYVLGGELEVATDLAVGVKFIRRELGEVIEDISVDQGMTYFITNPGGTYTSNPTNGVPLDPPTVFPQAERTFDGIELSLNKRFSNNWQLYSSLLWSQLEGNYEGLYSRDNRQIDPNITSKFDLPDLLDNAYGMLPNDREWQFKLYGSYHFDWGLTAGANMFYLTGTPVSKLGAHRTYGLDERFVTQRGTEGRTEDWMNWDLHLSYPISLGDFSLELMLDVFNVFDEQAAVEVDQRWTINDQTDDCPDCQTNDKWGEPLVYAAPRNIRLGARFIW